VNWLWEVFPPPVLALLPPPLLPTLALLLSGSLWISAFFLSERHKSTIAPEVWRGEGTGGKKKPPEGGLEGTSEAQGVSLDQELRHKGAVRGRDGRRASKDDGLAGKAVSWPHHQRTLEGMAEVYCVSRRQQRRGAVLQRDAR